MDNVTDEQLDLEIRIAKVLGYKEKVTTDGRPGDFFFIQSPDGKCLTNLYRNASEAPWHELFNQGRVLGWAHDWRAIHHMIMRMSEKGVVTTMLAVNDPSADNSPIYSWSIIQTGTNLPVPFQFTNVHAEFLFGLAQCYEAFLRWSKTIVEEEENKITDTLELINEKWWHCQHGRYREDSVLAGQEFRQLCRAYPDLKTAMAAHPEIPEKRIYDYDSPPPRAEAPLNPPDWFDPLNAGEAWGEDDY